MISVTGHLSALEGSPSAELILRFAQNDMLESVLVIKSKFRRVQQSPNKFLCGCWFVWCDPSGIFRHRHARHPLASV